MLAELHGKLDPDPATAVDRSEDLLTSAVFGAVRHLLRHALVAVCEAAGVVVDASAASKARVELWPRIPMPRRPGVWIEPDVIVVIGRQPLVFEAKLHSPFGMYPDPGDPDAPSLHQMAVQYAALRAWAAGERLLPPVIVAVTAPPHRPVGDLSRAAADVVRLCPDAPDGVLRWLPWSRIAAVLEALGDLRVHERTLVSGCPCGPSP